MADKRVYAFGKDQNGKNITEGNTDMKWIVGGKGANLAEMANLDLPVPPGYSISCQTCMEYANAGNIWPEGALDEIWGYTENLEERMGKRIGDKDDPLLVSVTFSNIFTIHFSPPTFHLSLYKTPMVRFGYEKSAFLRIFNTVSTFS